MAIPSGYYGRIAPRSSSVLNKFIHMVAGVIDTNFREELGVILFKSWDNDFELNMGDTIGQVIFEK